MNTELSTQVVEGFVCHTISNKQINLILVPELGGRVVSIYDKLNSREWLDGWSPSDRRRLWHPDDPERYDSGPGAGLDECLPTVLPCRIGNRRFTDHGELWRTAPGFSIEGRDLVCLWHLQSLPLILKRAIRLEGDTITMRYRLENCSPDTIPFQWAWHALLKLEDGDIMTFEDRPETCRSPSGEALSWPSPLPGQDLSRGDTGSTIPSSAKVFLGPFQQGMAKVQGAKSALELSWPSDLFPWAGIWVTRGAWKGLHHWAIEPTNGAFDRLSELPASSLTRMERHEKRDWTVTIRLNSSRC
ncbi:hypothetical protein [Roseibacillus persicicus]|uniref:Galactose mutarotase n=1 Tax=Roseibacillus persicicus TaxID=454148 RepID=A0A918TRT0_9BACT|nr:hypothetical protein [Roseibacillus persicicus]GHC60187.1 hypothetical protein GCM10007100_29320 [Roseibacillus persicicus]